VITYGRPRRCELALRGGSIAHIEIHPARGPRRAPKQPWIATDASSWAGLFRWCSTRLGVLLVGGPVSVWVWSLPAGYALCPSHVLSTQIAAASHSNVHSKTHSVASEVHAAPWARTDLGHDRDPLQPPADWCCGRLYPGPGPFVDAGLRPGPTRGCVVPRGTLPASSFRF
jgi:hypothetical protein